MLTCVRMCQFPFLASQHVCVCVYVCVLQTIHDYEHMGRSNDFLVNTTDTLAVRYNGACTALLNNLHYCQA